VAIEKFIYCLNHPYEMWAHGYETPVISERPNLVRFLSYAVGAGVSAAAGSLREMLTRRVANRRWRPGTAVFIDGLHSVLWFLVSPLQFVTLWAWSY
jgi:hypothetical protein